VVALVQRFGEGTRCARAADAREQLLRDDDAHRAASLGERLVDVGVRVSDARAYASSTSAITCPNPSARVASPRRPAHRDAQGRVARSRMIARHVVHSLAHTRPSTPSAMTSRRAGCRRRRPAARAARPRGSRCRGLGATASRRRRTHRVRGFLRAGRALDVDDALIGVARELVEEARVKPRIR